MVSVPKWCGPIPRSPTIISAAGGSIRPEPRSGSAWPIASRPWNRWCGGCRAAGQNGAAAARRLELNVGDKILIGKYSGSEIKIGDEDMVILREDEILAVIEA